MPVQNQVGDLLGVARGPEDFPVVLPQQVQIRVEIGSVAFQIVLDAELCPEEGAGQFCPQFLAGIVRRVPLGDEESMQAGLVTGPVPQFVKRDAIVGGGVRKPLARRQDDAVLARTIIGDAARVRDPRSALAEENLQPIFGVPAVIRPAVGRTIDLLQRRDALDLGGVEHGARTQQRDGSLERQPVLAEQRFPIGIVGRVDFERLEKIDGGAACPGRHLPAPRLGLLVTTPAGIVQGQQARVQQQDVDAAIKLAGRGVDRPGRCVGVARVVPRPLPGRGPVLNHCYDPIGDFLIHISPRAARRAASRPGHSHHPHGLHGVLPIRFGRFRPGSRPAPRPGMRGCVAVSGGRTPAGRAAASSPWRDAWRRDKPPRT